MVVGYASYKLTRKVENQTFVFIIFTIGFIKLLIILKVSTLKIAVMLMKYVNDNLALINSICTTR